VGYKRRSLIFGNNITKKGFALPTILISSVIMLTVLLVSVSSTTAIRSAILTQYYSQLAQVAGDAGVAYAQACLAQNSNVPLWNDAKPLTPSTDCSGNTLGLICPGAVNCYVSLNGNVRSSFKVGLPTLDANGKASKIPNTGYVQVLRTSTGDVWRTYNQPSVQSAVVPDLCSGTATSLLGWNNAADQQALASVLVVGGGGGGGEGGGGAGGVISTVVTPYIQSYTITVGAGGVGSTNGAAVGANGSNSTAFGLTALGGGAGGASSSSNGSLGGSGGGGRRDGAGIAGLAVFGQGNNGGGILSSQSYKGGSGGGGAGGVGIAGSGNATAAGETGGNGGLGVSNSITGSPVWYAGGGGGAVEGAGGSAGQRGLGGNGGGGAGYSNQGGTFTAVAGSASTGGGGGGRPTNAGSGTAGSGGSGVVIISYPDGSITATGGIVPGGTLVGGNRVHTFTSSGTFNVTAVRAVQSGWPSFPDSSALPIGISSGDVIPGTIYLRKDFNVSEAGTYNLNLQSGDSAQGFIDGKMIANSNSNLATGSVALSVGCHAVYVELTNGGVDASGAFVLASLKKSDASTPIVVSDTTWRVSAGTSKHFSQVGYDQDPAAWSPARDQGAISTSPWTSTPADWPDMGARWIGSIHSYSLGAYPNTSYSYYTSGSPAALNISTPGDYNVAVACDDNCRVYIDGAEVTTCTSGWSITCNLSVTLTQGAHQMGVELYNGGASPNNAGFLFSVIQKSTGRTILHSDDSWLASSSWYGARQSLYSYSTQYYPNPRITNPASIRVLLVGGGGGGARTGSGGGAGGYVYNSSYSVYPGVYSVVVGAGGIGGTTTGVSTYPGTRGSNSIFNDLVAEGGGGGATHTNTAGVTGNPGGSGGGAPIDTLAGHIGGFGSQGNLGGAVALTAGWTGNSGGGGGAGGAGATGCNTSGCGNGGAGLANPITGSVVAGGGGAGEVVGSFIGTGGNGGGGSGVIDSAGTNGVANTGGGGGGGSYNGSYFNGGAGGSGIVIISYPTGLITATVTGGATTYNSGNTIHTFTSNGTFTVTSIN